MGKFVKSVGSMFGMGSSSQKRKAAAAANQAAIQTQVANVNQQNAIAEQASASSRALGGQTRSRRGSRLFSAQDGKKTLG